MRYNPKAVSAGPTVARNGPKQVWWRQFVTVVGLAFYSVVLTMSAVPAVAASHQIGVIGSITPACSGRIEVVTLGEGTESQFAELVIGSTITSLTVPPGQHAFLRHGQPGDQVILRGPADAELDRAFIPTCSKYKALIRANCHTRLVSSWLVNKSDYTRTFLVGVSPGRDSFWSVRVKAHHSVKFSQRLAFKQGTIVAIQLITHGDGPVLDIRRTGARC